MPRSKVALLQDDESSGESGRTNAPIHGRSTAALGLSVTALAIALVSLLVVPGPVGSPGSAGAAGVPCWDLNGNGLAELAVEDRNGDLQVNVLDCAGPAGSAGAAGGPGPAGLHCWDLDADGLADVGEDVNGDSTIDAWDCAGATGPTGNNGTAGPSGPRGLACWDLDGDGVGTVAEDANSDGDYDALDCRGTDGTSGTNGLSCWDLNGDGQADLNTEDLNSDNAVDILDCQGAPGGDGTDGLACWDANGNGIGDLPAEDLNSDLLLNTLDCAGPQGPQGPPGADGQACWDLDGDGLGDPGEDLNGDLAVDVLDCRGAPGADGTDGADGANGTNGADGLHCWDLNWNGVGDPASEDTNGDAAVDVLDCRGLSPVMAYNSTTLGVFFSTSPVCTFLMRITIVVPAAGDVIVQAQEAITLDHTTGTDDSVALHLATDVTCTAPTVNRWTGMIPKEYPTIPSVSMMAFHQGRFSVGAAGAYTFYVGGFMLSGDDITDRFDRGSMVAVYYPT